MFRRRIISFFSVLIALCPPLAAQELKIIHEKPGLSIRGLSAVTDKVIWVSGNDGTVGRSTDGGTSWTWHIVAGHENRDFRDIEAFNTLTAIIMAIGEPAVILKTKDGGATWRKVYENRRSGMFLDAIDFWNDQSGIVVGDPVAGKFFIAHTHDGGETWKEMRIEQLPPADDGEACFAASGTNIRMINRTEAAFVSGGSISRLRFKGSAMTLPLLYGKETQGANSVAIWQPKSGLPQIAIVGGDFSNDSSRTGNALISWDGGKSWIRPSNPPYGYRSCVEYVSADRLVACGINGVDVSLDKGINWNALSDNGFHVCRKTKNGKALFLAGSGGRIARLEW